MKKDYRYLAGIIDGEGCISLAKNGTKYTHIKIIVINTSKDLIFWLKKNFNGWVRFNKSKVKNHKDCWVWAISCQKAVNILKKILPYLIIKKQQAELAIKFQKTISRNYAGCGIPEEVLLQRKEMFDIMKQLNKKGICPHKTK